MKKILLLVCVLFVSFQMNAYADSKSKTIKAGKNKMDIVLSENTTEVDITYDSDKPPKSGHGHIGELKLIVKDGEEHTLTRTKDEIEFETSTNPNCHWLIIGRQYFYICEE